MDRLTYHKENIEQAQFKIEEFIAHSDGSDNDFRIYGIMKACVLAIGYILEWIHRESRKS